MRTLVYIIILCASSAAAQTQQPPTAKLPEGVEPVTFPAVSIIMTTETGSFELLLELAVTPNQQTRGLMFRENLPDNYGMLFMFEESQKRSFWMRNTLSPLDIVFITEDGTIDSVKQGIPLNETSIQSNGPVKFVLEVREGLAKEYGLYSGSKVAFN